MAEALALVATTLYAVTIRHPRMHSPGGLRGPAIAQPLSVWISTAGEPMSVLEPTLAAASRIRHSPKRIFVLDDRGSPNVKALAQRYGARYLARPTHEDAKAGNLNHALVATSSDPTPLILTLDADQVPEPEIMQRLAGYFRFPRVAFVQTQQLFVLPNGDPFTNADSLFYCVMQTSKDADNAAFSCGSGVVYRRAALDEIGGFSSWNLVEDVHTSMRLHAAGWTSIYHPFALTTGTAPSDIVGYTRQRTQWATDSVRMLLWDNPFRYRGLTLAQKLHYVYTGGGYVVAGIIMPLYYLTPVLSLFVGFQLTLGSAREYAMYRGVYLAFTLLAIGTLQRPVRGLKYFRMWAGGFPVHVKAIVGALRSRVAKPPYKVTPKLPSVPSGAARLAQVSPQLAVVALLAVAVPYGWMVRVLPVDALVVNTAWGAWVVWILTGVIGAALQSGAPVAHASRAPTIRSSDLGNAG